MKKLGLLVMPMMAISLLASCGGDKPGPHPADKNEYLCFTCNSDSGDLGLSCVSEEGYEEYLPTLEYSTDKNTWTKAEKVSSTSEPTLIHHFKKGESLFLRGDNPNGFNNIKAYSRFVTNFSNNDSSTDFSISGNVMSLLGKDKFNDLIVIPSNDCFANLFRSCDITDASGLVLPATALTERGYSNMFGSCQKLIKAPELPALYLENSCYSGMFSNCTNLVKAPDLPAEEIPYNCYKEMFRDCTNLVNGPTISMKKLNKYSCCYMFYNCTKLVSVSIPSIIEVNDDSCSHMFENCTNLLTAPSLSKVGYVHSGCYSYMFANCENLKEADFTLSDENLTQYCYDNMFNGCTNLILPPKILAKTLAHYSCNCMFFGCSNLNVVDNLEDPSGIEFFKSPELSFAELSEVAGDMFNGTSQGILTPESNTTYYYIPASN